MTDDLNEGMVSWNGVDGCGCPPELLELGLHRGRCEVLIDPNHQERIIPEIEI
jgi:hypothetical protein